MPDVLFSSKVSSLGGTSFTHPVKKNKKVNKIALKKIIEP
jgi:hypothetical protein